MGNEISENNYLNCVARCILFDQEKKMPTSEKENDKCLPALLADGCNDRRASIVPCVCVCVCLCECKFVCSSNKRKKKLKQEKKVCTKNEDDTANGYMP